MYDVASEELFWSARSRTFSPESVEEVIVDLTKLLIEDLEEKNIHWINSFQSILELSLKQITKLPIQITKAFSNDIKNEQNCKILIQLTFNPNIEYVSSNEPNFKYQKQIQVNSDPENKIKILNEGLIVNLYDETKNKTIDISSNINELKNETWLKFLDIAYEIKKEIGPERKDSKKFKGNIYVAETSAEKNTNRATIIRELEHLDYRILPETNFPKDMVSFSELVHSNMKESFLSIHIIGNIYAPLIENIDISTIELQNDLFHEVASELNANSKVIKRLVWIPPDIKPKSEKQKLYVESFKRNIELLKNTEIIQTPIEVFKTIIKDKAEELLQSKTVEDNEEKKTNSVYLISNNIDSDHYKEIKKQLLQKKLDVLEAINSANKIDQIQNHYYNIVNCDALLIDYSVENYQWLNSKLSDIIKSPGFGRKSNFLSKSILVNTVKSPEIKIEINNLDLIINQKKDINQSLAPFIEKIEKNDT